MRRAAVFIAIVGCGIGCAPARGPVAVPPPVPDAGVAIDAPWVPPVPPPPPAPLEPLPAPIELVAPAPPVARACPAPAGAPRDRAFGPVTTITSPTDDPRVAHLGTRTFTIDRFEHSVLLTDTEAGALTSGVRRIDDWADCTGLTTACAIDPQLLAAGNELYALYAGDDIGVRVRASHDRGATFGPSTIALGGAVAGVTASADGHVHVAAIRGGPLGAYGSANHVLEYAVSIDHGAHFSRPIAISGRDDQLPLLAARPAIATDTARRLIYVVYVRGGRDLAWELVVASSKDLGATWKRTAVTTPMPSPCALRLAPAVAIDPATGTLHVIWFDSRGDGRLAHATCPTGAPRCTELAAISDAPIATPLDPAAAPPIAAIAIDSKRHTLRAIWTQLDAAGAPTLVQATAPLAHR